ncbi:hypothetical protein HanHA300_Chr04g0147531 [Helianthus annuus]|nr:hypothetical protein HanHA300_Chr04g0147531 [Helianthus annuus]KAJ0597994.1 hypothetical protein HanHA89_Chr04g0160881 [Helianthus annuus]KAJ0758625.1 hypothetical protein HanLR1_Chr04g0152471 [Helianthus annuus]KAJ0762295.1 hypothetical protein HanOQP8_Chr04g0159751 [Helianthus annuus]
MGRKKKKKILQKLVLKGSLLLCRNYKASTIIIITSKIWIKVRAVCAYIANKYGPGIHLLLACLGSSRICYR